MGFPNIRPKRWKGELECSEAGGGCKSCEKRCVTVRGKNEHVTNMTTRLTQKKYIIEASEPPTLTSTRFSLYGDSTAVPIESPTLFRMTKS